MIPSFPRYDYFLYISINASVSNLNLFNVYFERLIMAGEKLNVLEGEDCIILLSNMDGGNSNICSG